MSAGLDSLQTDMWRLFRDYLAKRDIAMLTIDMPSLGASSHWPLTEDSSCLHQAVLNQLADLPWVDHFRIGLIGFRFGGNAMARLAFLESDKVKACVSLGAQSTIFSPLPRSWLPCPNVSRCTGVTFRQNVVDVRSYPDN